MDKYNNKWKDKVQQKTYRNLLNVVMNNINLNNQLKIVLNSAFNNKTLNK